MDYQDHREQWRNEMAEQLKGKSSLEIGGELVGTFIGIAIGAKIASKVVNVIFGEKK